MKTVFTGILGVLCGLLLAGAIVFLILPERGEGITISTLTPALIMVQIDGAVNIPGVYTFSQEVRLQEIINKSGGLREDADTSSINLVSKINDGQKIHVPSLYEENSVSVQQVEDPTLIDINTANLEQLGSLPGIGESKALEIISYREQYGNFLHIHDILNVPGIGQSIFDKIQSRITVK
jgi:competence protein ComEA